MSEADDVNITVSSKYISNTPDLQMRLFIRAYLKNNAYDLSETEKIEILRNEADRCERTLPTLEDVS